MQTSEFIPPTNLTNDFTTGGTVDHASTAQPSTSVIQLGEQIVRRI